MGSIPKTLGIDHRGWKVENKKEMLLLHGYKQARQLKP